MLIDEHIVLNDLQLHVLRRVVNELGAPDFAGEEERKLDVLVAARTTIMRCGINNARVLELVEAARQAQVNVPTILRQQP